MNKIEFGDCREIMKRWIDEGVKIQTCITSPPYYGLRDYGTATWEGGDINCDHKDARSRGDDIKDGDKQGTNAGSRPNKKFICECGAKRVDNQIGLEQTPKEYIENMVDVFNHVKELLADDGTLWVNIGDSYSSGGRTSTTNQSLRGNAEYGVTRPPVIQGIKPKDLIGIPWMLAFALREAGWYLRQDIIWHKPNPMPESVTDRCTKSHEYIFLLSKSPKYYFDNEAIKEPCINSTEEQMAKRNKKQHRENASEQEAKYVQHNFSKVEKIYEKRNKRDVWSVTVKPFKGAHFATYPKDLIEPCILAGTSEKGHCPVCNAKWKRMKIDTGERHDVEVYTGKAVKDYEHANVQNPSDTKRRVLESMSKIYKYEWIPTCECRLEPVPDIVFDPFMGSGTTAQVALQHGRQYLGCELNKEYEKLQQERINNG